MESKIQIGQTLYATEQRYRSNKSKPAEIIEYTVVRVGRKYFYCAHPNSPTREMSETFCLETLRYSSAFSAANIQLYLTREEILDGRERDKLHAALRDHFSHYTGGSSKNTLEELRAAAATLRIEV